MSERNDALERVTAAVQQAGFRPNPAFVRYYTRQVKEFNAVESVALSDGYAEVRRVVKLEEVPQLIAPLTLGALEQAINEAKQAYSEERGWADGWVRACVYAALDGVLSRVRQQSG